MSSSLGAAAADHILTIVGVSFRLMNMMDMSLYSWIIPLPSTCLRVYRWALSRWLVVV